MKLALDPLTHLQPTSFCIPYATFGMVPIMEMELEGTGLTIGDGAKEHRLEMYE